MNGWLSWHGGKDKRRGASAVASFDWAAGLYNNFRGNGIHAPDVDMQLAAPLATPSQLNAHALSNIGRDAAAQAVRLDSQGWARYGFGAEKHLR